MNAKELNLKRRENGRLLDPNLGFHKYCCVRLNPHNSYKHEKQKFDKAFELLKMGHKFVTEAKSLDDDRIFDVFDLDTGDVWKFEKNLKIKKEGAKTRYL